MCNSHGQCEHSMAKRKKKIINCILIANGFRTIGPRLNPEGGEIFVSADKELVYEHEEEQELGDDDFFSAG